MRCRSAGWVVLGAMALASLGCSTSKSTSSQSDPIVVRIARADAQERKEVLLGSDQPPDPCALLTDQQVSQELGRKFHRSRPKAALATAASGSRSCFWWTGSGGGQGLLTVHINTQTALDAADRRQVQLQGFGFGRALITGLVEPACDCSKHTVVGTLQSASMPGLVDRAVLDAYTSGRSRGDMILSVIAGGSFIQLDTVSIGAPHQDQALVRLARLALARLPSPRPATSTPPTS